MLQRLKLSKDKILARIISEPILVINGVVHREVKRLLFCSG